MFTYRTATAADLDLLAAWTVEEPVAWISGERYLEELAEGMYRLEWTWLAELEGRVVGRALWWGPRGAAHPVALDCLDVLACLPDRTAAAAGLVAASRAAFTQPVQYVIKVEDGRREDPAVRWRRAAAVEGGLTREVERLQFEWRQGAPVPEPSGALRFEEADDAAFLAVFELIAEGSLDAQTRARVEAVGARECARQELGFYLAAPGKREWWRLARTPEGEVAGMAIPSATPYSVNVGYLGVAPRLRGRGYVDELLGEITRIHASAPRITATTDAANAPMAAAFRRAGYVNTEVRIVLSDD